MHIQLEIERAASALHVQLALINETDRDGVREKALHDFVTQPFHFRWLWEHLIDCENINDPEGWKYIDEFVNKKRVVLFFNEFEDKSMFELDGSRLTELIGECYGFEFYVTDAAADFLICYNHHDCLFATGTAKNWLANKITTIRPSNQPSE